MTLPENPTNILQAVKECLLCLHQRIVMFRPVTGQWCKYYYRTVNVFKNHNRLKNILIYKNENIGFLHRLNNLFI